MTHIKFLLAAAVGLLVSFGGVVACATGPEGARPRVLIIGDSISLGYTPLVKQKLAGTAEVLRPNENCQHTAHGLKQIDAWLGDGKWDVIHFNFGIWDSHLIGPKGNLVWPEPAEIGENKQRRTPEEYQRNLTALVAKMKATGATVIWASTTPVTSRTGERFEAIKKLNAAAAEVAAAEKLEVNDLYEFVMPNAEKWLGGDKVHFSAEGNKQLADKVSASIAQALAKRAKLQQAGAKAQIDTK
jgi:hypothetical protein